MFDRFWLSLWLLIGLFTGADLKKVSVVEGDSVSLESGRTQIRKQDVITWMFGSKQTLIAQIIKEAGIFKTFDEGDAGEFRDRLKLDNQTGSLTISNTRITDSGLYHLHIAGMFPIIFRVIVDARLPDPVISRNSSSSSSSSSCSVECSVVNVSHVTLSWLKGHSLLSSISISDLSIGLSLHLECVDDSYSCVVSKSFTKRTTHLNPELCESCSESVSGYDFVEAVTRLVVTALVGVAAVAAVVVLVYDIRSRRAEED